MLTMEQFKHLIPDSLVSYISSGTLIIFDTISVPISSLSGKCGQPVRLLLWESNSDTLNLLSQQVKLLLVNPL